MSDWQEKRLWADNIPLGNIIYPVPKRFVYIKGYLHPEGEVFGEYDYRAKHYILSDGDCHKPEDMEWLGDEFFFVGEDEISEIVKEHLRKKAAG